MGKWPSQIRHPQGGGTMRTWIRCLLRSVYGFLRQVPHSSLRRQLSVCGLLLAILLDLLVALACIVLALAIVVMLQGLIA